MTDRLSKEWPAAPAVVMPAELQRRGVEVAEQLEIAVTAGERDRATMQARRFLDDIEKWKSEHLAVGMIKAAHTDPQKMGALLQ